ncbi:MAG: flavin reductase family protein [Bacteroidota bacterium]
MKKISPQDLSTGEFYGYLISAVAPRPVAFASTVDKQGNVNLSPYSFFNCFSANPPVLVFSPTSRARDNTNKHTLENVLEVDEVVINIANYPMVEQMSLSSAEYAKDVNEFVKAGFTQETSELVKPPRVKESPVAFECKVTQVVKLGNEGGAGNLVVCEVLMMHVNEEILDEKGKIDPFKMDYISRMGGNLYCRVIPESIISVPRPNRDLGMGVDQIPEHIRNSEVLTGNNLGRLGNVHQLPSTAEVEAFKSDPAIQDLFKRFQNDRDSLEYHLHQLAQQYLRDDEVEKAWKVLLQI